MVKGARGQSRRTRPAEELPGWRTATGGARSAAELPAPARDYLELIAAETGVPVTLASVGSRREETVHIDHPRAAPAVAN